LKERFVIGLVGAPFGLEGFVKVRPLSGEIDHLLKLQSVVLRQGATEKTVIIEECAPALSQVVMKFAGIGSPEAAKTLRGAELIAGREQASPLGPGEFYVEDLRGLAVAAAHSGPAANVRPGETSGASGDRDGPEEILGHITDILEGGGGDLAEIRLSTGEVRLVPFRKEFFAPINPETGRVVLLNRWILA
jgi:16S rRNA processing protein RimM